MKKASTLILLALLPACLFAQKPLTNSRTSGFYTYVYQLDDASTRSFYLGNKKPDDRMLHQPLDSFQTEHPRPWHLPAGNYLQVHAKLNQLEYKLIENHSAYLKLLEGTKDIRFILLGDDNREVNNAEVSSGRKKIGYNDALHFYQNRRTKKDTLLEVKYKGVINFYKLRKEDAPDDDYDYSTFVRSITPRRSNWFKQSLAFVATPFRLLFGGKKQARRKSIVAPPNPGYVVFNKPKYRPGDTVKLKAFLLTAKSYKPIGDAKLAVRLTNGNYNDAGKLLGYADSYHDGGYTYSFKLDDSLKLSLDRDYYIRLESADNNFDVRKDSRNYFLNRKVNIQSSFRYEDYELKTNKFTVRVDKTDQSPGVPAAIYMRATDDNGLDIADARVNVVLRMQSAQQFTDTHVFVPDTLWHHEMKLDPVGETKLSIPDSIFPHADINYIADVVLLNSNNERHEETKYMHYNNRLVKITHQLQADSLTLNYLEKGKSLTQKATLYGIGENEDTLVRKSITLPLRFAVDPAVAKYLVKTNAAADSVNMNIYAAPLDLNAVNTGDSLKISAENPARLKLWYTVFNGSKVVGKGQATDLPYKKIAQGKNMSVMFNYLWAGRVQSDLVVANFRDKALAVTVKQPSTVFPGQQADISIHINDAKGKPVANADVTAYALTSKFENYGPPEVPYLGNPAPKTKAIAGLSIYKLWDTGAIKINWLRWSRQMGLDSIEYYKFTRPDSIYRVTEAMPDSGAQIAPFVVKDGDIIPVHILYLDNVPVYFSKTNDLQRYSFKVDSGRHDLTFRTGNQLIQLNNVLTGKTGKLILSINADTLKSYATFKTMPDTLSTYEANLMAKYTTVIVPNFGDHLAEIDQDDDIFLLGVRDNQFGRGLDYQLQYMGGNLTRGLALVGPIKSNHAVYKINGQSVRDFYNEPGYSFLLQPQLIKQTSLPVGFPYNSKLALFRGGTDYNQYALTHTAVDTIWQNYLDNRAHNQGLFYNNFIYSTTQGQLILNAGKLAGGDVPFVKSIILYKYADPDFVRIYPGSSTNLGNVDAGRYRVMLLFKGGQYLVKDNIIVKPYGQNYYDFGRIEPHAKDSTSIKINAVIDNRDTYIYQYDGSADVQEIKEAFNAQYLDQTVLTGIMSGYLYEQNSNLSIPGAIIKVRGMASGTVTDAKGHFKLKVPESGHLVITSVGYMVETVPIKPGAEIKLYLNALHTMLKGVTIVGNTPITYKADTVEYRASDYKVRPGASVNDMLKKMSGMEIGADGSVTAQGQQVTRIRLNGKDYFGGDVQSITKNLPADVIESIQMIDDYGDQANVTGIKTGDPTKILNINVHKILSITTKGGVMPNINDPALLAMQSIRKNFSDYAFWQPKLVTDADGNAKFKTTFPDDITSWNTFVIGMTGNRQSGMAAGQIRSYKPLSANLTQPLFAVRGDEMNVIGKVMNYTADTLQMKRTFKLNGELANEKNISVKNSVIDTFRVTAAGKDSLKLAYTLKRTNGYFDGEERSIPVFEQGTLETKGTFAALDKDSTITITLDPKLKEGTFHAEASVLPVLLDETEHLRDYEYLCNEQLASKLIGLLTEKKIRKYLGEPFKYDENINEIIKKLQETRRAEGTWGWWKDTNEELWISTHVVDGLLEAEAQGFKTTLDKTRLIQYLLYRVNAFNGYDKLGVIMLLKKLGARADYATLVNNYEKSLAPEAKLPLYNKIQIMQARQIAGLPFNRDSLMSWAHQTMFGNVYWGDESYYFFNNSIEVSIKAYQLLKAEGKHPELLTKLRNYFLEQRHTGYWRNTYESAQILETILPDLLVDGKKPEPSVITLSGTKNETVTQFPYSTRLAGGTSLTIKKTGTMPVYITAYQKFWNSGPEKVNKDFTVNTTFLRNNQPVSKAKGGETVTLKAEVSARASADYVMVEIPIPAGCSYLDKAQGYFNGEVHREYFKNKVCIFCRSLTEGKHTFTISLTARYGGTYHVNPAKAELMYFPVFYGREGMKVFGVE